MNATSTVTVVATISVQPDSHDVVVAALLEAVAATRLEDGCEHYALHQDTQRPDRLVMLERWRDEAALDAHARGPAFEKLVGVITGKASLEVVKLRAL
jgi:quinol monooxygenase YgiN